MVETYQVAVRTMAARVLRSGDLRVEFSGPHRAREGIRIHRRIQKSRPDHYTPEVPVSYTVRTGKLDLRVSGRIDGIYRDAGDCTIEEIKTTVRDLEQVVRAPDAVHLGQAHCYAYMYAMAENLKQVRIHLTYCQIESGQTATWEEICTVAELERRFMSIAGRYLEQVEWLMNWQAERNASIAVLEFPFEAFRGGQRAMAVDVYRAVRDQRQLLVQAATGIGKTMAALFPAVKALPDLKNPAILYLTARTTGRLAADKAIAGMRAKGLRLKALAITAKDKICFQAKRDCTPEMCQYARGYFNRVDGARQAMLHFDDFSRSCIESTAREFGICPFELSLELTAFADCIICDYNYVFDPRVSLKRLVVESDRRCIYLVDEAHNLVDRSRDMFSAQLDKKALLDLRRRIGKQRPDLFKSLGRVNRWMVAAGKQCQTLPGGLFSQQRAPADLLTRVTVLVRKAEKWLVENPDAAFREDLLEIYFQCTTFLRTAEQYGDEYVTLMEKAGRDFRVKLFCLDPAIQLKRVLDHAVAAVFFSATMTPAAYFRRLLGCSDDTPALQIGSPFPGDRLGVFVADRIATFYRQRTETLSQLVDILTEMVAGRQGNYLFFFPSYRYLAMVHERLVKMHPSLRVVVQSPDMDAAEKQAFLQCFHEGRDETLVGFAVLGGIFGEGIDLTGDRLSGAAVIGVGLPGISFENELIKEYFETAQGAGFQYAYQYPGINRVLQGAGRVIRTSSDRGVVLLVDQRYARYSYRGLLPKQWCPVKICDDQDLKMALKTFWRD